MMYTYKAKVLRVVDGDTLDVRVDLGFNVTMDMKVRLAGINAPELSTDEGKKVRAALIAKIGDADVTITTIKDRQEKYGRYLATVTFGETNINEWLVDKGFAVRYQS